jgi:IS5 family transposase
LAFCIYQAEAGFGQPPGQPARLGRRPIAKGRINRPVEFGFKAQVVDNEDGIVIDYTVEGGNPADAPMLAPAIKRKADRLGKPQRAVTADCGHGEARVDADLYALGVKPQLYLEKDNPARPDELPNTAERSAMRPNGKPATKAESATSNTATAGPTVRSPAGDRTAAWCGHGVFAHNLVKITTPATKQEDHRGRTQAIPPRPRKLVSSGRRS